MPVLLLVPTSCCGTPTIDGGVSFPVKTKQENLVFGKKCLFTNINGLPAGPSAKIDNRSQPINTA